ncbi:MAG: 5-formyltetrahydrofolate cyclo-ligase [Verrucomicrobia bacterium]|jgi:5-formyltetrahydrofolate cyclo-ligase|nr:5-formyltetrahydrofolate cyclo-ligase [Verrucomicrobiota bacterium]
MSKMAVTKQQLRENMRRERAALEPDWVASRSSRISERFVALDAFRTAETVCLYVAISGEVLLDAAMAQCWDQGKRLLVPAYCKARGEYGFKAMTRETVMANGPWGVPEPKEVSWAEITPAACIAVPGVAFDEAGGRVGHGKGYYDRLLADAVGDTHPFKVGVCFDFQRLDSVPSEAWDVGMDMVISETRVTRAQSRA